MCFEMKYTNVHWIEASEFLNTASPGMKNVLVPRFSKFVVAIVAHRRLASNTRNFAL